MNKALPSQSSEGYLEKDLTGGLAGLRGTATPKLEDPLSFSLVSLFLPAAPLTRPQAE